MIPRVPRTLSIVPLLIALSACSETESSVGDALSGQWVDLTHDFSPETLYWPTSPPFELTVESRGEAEGGYWYEAYSFRSAEHGGTHIDAPVHFAKGRRSVEAIPLDDLVGPACVINVATAAIADADYQVTVADIEAWESQHGALPAGAIVFIAHGLRCLLAGRRPLLGHRRTRPGSGFRTTFPRAASRRSPLACRRTPPGRHWHRYAKHRFRPIAAVRIASHPVRAQRSRLRERGESGSPAGGRSLGYRAAHEDSRRQRRPFANRRVATPASAGVVTTLDGREHAPPDSIS